MNRRSDRMKIFLLLEKIRHTRGGLPTTVYKKINAIEKILKFATWGTRTLSN